MSKFVQIFSSLLLILSFTFSSAAYTVQVAVEGETTRLRWRTATIPIAFSTSLLKPNPNFKNGSDVQGAIQRSLETWEKVSNVEFQISWTEKQSISPAGNSGDGVNLVSIGQTPENLLLFANDEEAVSARTRIFFNRKGSITEADIILNPYEQFSTDGTFGTFDLEATLTHELGHLLGLEHSSVVGATMHKHTGKNGVYNLPGFAQRTLADDDISGIRALYGSIADDDKCCGTLSGKLIAANGKAAKNYQVWSEDIESGRVIAGVLSNAEGDFRMEGLPVGRYKIYARDFDKKLFSAEEFGEIEIAKDKTQTLNRKLKNQRKNFDVRYMGFNGQVSDLAVPVNGGKFYTIYVGGKNLEAKNLSIGFNSRYVSVMPGSLRDHDYGEEISVVSFEIRTDDKIPSGEYSFFLTNKANSTDFAVGGITVEQIENSWESYVRLTTE